MVKLYRFTKQLVFMADTEEEAREQLQDNLSDVSNEVTDQSSWDCTRLERHLSNEWIFRSFEGKE